MQSNADDRDGDVILGRYLSTRVGDWDHMVAEGGAIASLSGGRG